MLVNLKVTCYIQWFFHPLWAISILYHYFSFEILRIRDKRTILNYWHSQWTLCWDQWILWYIQFHFLVQSSYLYSFWTFTEISNIWKDTNIHSDIHIESVFFFVIPSLFYLEIIWELSACRLNYQLHTMNNQYKWFANNAEGCGVLTYK